MTTIRKAVREVQAFLDLYNKVFVFLSAITLALILYFQISISAAVAIFTAVYAFIAFNSMRGRQGIWTNSPTVRRDFRNEDSEAYDFGLRNFGPGPALNLRVHATIEPDGPNLTIHGSDTPLHLEEGEFLSLLQGDFAELRDEESDLYEQDDETEVELYYTFESTSGEQTPPTLENPTQMGVNELVEKANDPRTEKLRYLRKNCTRQSEIVEETPL